MRELTTGEICYYNWNRIGFLMRLRNLTDVKRDEIDMRIGFQNIFSNANADETKELDIIEHIRRTLSDRIIDSVDKFMKKNPKW